MSQSFHSMTFILIFSHSSFFNFFFLQSVAARLRDLDNACLHAASRYTNALQLGSLQILSPLADGLKDGGGGDKDSIKSVSKTKEKSSKEKHKSETTSKAGDGCGNDESPARRIHRPVSIRRPKLIGKSVEGAAMQAVAASRARASANRFKQPSALSKRPQRDSGTLRDNARVVSAKSSLSQTDSSTTDSTRSMQPARSANDENKRHDEILIRVMGDFRLLISTDRKVVRRLNSLQRQALTILANVWWPRDQSYTIPKSVGEYLISKVPITWSDACTIPPIPSQMLDIFPLSFSKWVAAWTPGLQILPLPSINGPVNIPNSVLLSSEVKNVRGSKCLAVVRISRARVTKKQHSRTVIRCEGWILNLPRRPKADRIKAFDSNATHMMASEKDSAGMDKLASELHVSFSRKRLSGLLNPNSRPFVAFEGISRPGKSAF